MSENEESASSASPFASSSSSLSSSALYDSFDELPSLDWLEDDAASFVSSVISPNASQSSSSPTTNQIDLTPLYDAVPTRYVSSRASPEPIDSASAQACSRLCPQSGEETCWYFAIGSMINPTSLALRKLQPIESYPGILRGWRLVFVGDCGMASIVECNSGHRSLKNHNIQRDDFHGVLHRLTRDELDKLDVIENSYERLEVDVECYDGTLQRALVYKMLESKLDPTKPDALPSERYLDIISRGCVYFGVQREYIEWLRSHACVPRKKPSQYRKIPIHSLHQSGMKKLYMTAEELALYDGRPIETNVMTSDEEYERGKLDVGYDDDDETGIILESMKSSTSQNDDDPCSASHQAIASCTNLLSPTSSCIVSPSTSPPSSSSASSSSSSSLTLSSPLVPSSSTSDSDRHLTRRCYPLRIAVNKRILEWCGDLSQPLLFNTYEFMRHNFGGTDCTWSYTQVFFEPMFPIVSSYDAMSAEHRAMIEDIFAEKVLAPDESMREWKLVGFLSRNEQKSSQRVGKEKLRELHRLRDQSLERMIADEEGQIECQRHDATPYPCDDGMIVPPSATTPRRHPDFESSIFFSLSLEDHSGASSTCFAHCCANAQPFWRQREQHARTSRRRNKNYQLKGNTDEIERINDAIGCRSNPGGVMSARITHDALGMKRVARTEINRRHSIDGVGLHVLAQSTNSSSAMLPSRTTAVDVTLATPKTPLSSPMYLAPTNVNGSAAKTTASSNSIAHLLSPCAIPLPTYAFPLLADSRRHLRSQSICDGDLGINTTASHSASSDSCNHTLCFSPNRQQSVDLTECMLTSGLHSRAVSTNVPFG